MSWKSFGQIQTQYHQNYEYQDIKRFNDRNKYVLGTYVYFFSIFLFSHNSVSYLFNI